MYVKKVGECQREEKEKEVHSEERSTHSLVQDTPAFSEWGQLASVGLHGA